MSMVTQCPHCSTLFRVTPQQLQQRQGRVRCGRCREIFDGFHALSAEPEDVRIERLEASDSPQPQGMADADAAAPTPDRESEAIGEPTPALSDGPQDAPAALVDYRVPHAAAERASLWAAEDQLRNARRRRGGPIYAALSVVLAFALLAQAVYAYRADLGARFPGLRPLMMRWCAALHCTVPLPQRPRLISIEASDLQAIDSRRPGIIKLTATLRSHASYDLAYPALDLVLTNAQDHALARRIFLPREYLDATRNVAAGLPPSGEVTVRLDLDASGLDAAGFRLDLIRAPG